MKHELKILPAYFKAVVSGEKNFEIRDNRDRGFQKGDIVRLCEWEEGVISDSFTGRVTERVITYVTNFEQKEGFVVFGMIEEVG